MKAGTIMSTKMLLLARRLGVCRNHAAGIMDHFWEWTARNAPRGDVGRFSDEVLQEEVAPELKRKSLVDALVAEGWLDRADFTGLEPNQPAGWPRLYVHDWHDHCENRVRLWLTRKGECFANGMPPRRKEDDDGDDGSLSRHGRDIDPTQPRPCNHPRARPSPTPTPVISA